MDPLVGGSVLATVRLPPEVTVRLLRLTLPEVAVISTSPGLVPRVISPLGLPVCELVVVTVMLPPVPVPVGCALRLSSPVDKPVIAVPFKVIEPPALLAPVLVAASAVRAAPAEGNVNGPAGA